MAQQKLTSESRYLQTYNVNLNIQRDAFWQTGAYTWYVSFFVFCFCLFSFLMVWGKREYIPPLPQIMLSEFPTFGEIEGPAHLECNE